MTIRPAITGEADVMLRNLSDSPGDALESRGRAELRDGCGRQIDHLRLSVTAQCDLRCVYCRPGSGRPGSLGGDALTDEQRIELLRAWQRHFGLRQLRITGGEPLLHPRIAEFVAQARRALPGVVLAMTTNGQRLSGAAEPLRRAGLDRLNVSLDSLDPPTYAAITGGDVQRVLDGLTAARAAGFTGVRINVVVLRGLNDGELGELVSWAVGAGFELRLLELMPIGPRAERQRRLFVPVAEIIQRVRCAATLTPLPAEPGRTAQRFHASSGDRVGVVGIIASMTQPFCADCGRVRITADGRLYSCLLDERYADLRPIWEGECLDEQRMVDAIQRAVSHKQRAGPRQQQTAMTVLGG